MIAVARLLATLFLLAAWGRGLAMHLQHPLPESPWMIAAGSIGCAFLLLCVWMPKREVDGHGRR